MHSRELTNWMFVIFVCDCPDHHWTWYGCNLPTAVPKLSPDDLQTALHLQAKGRWPVDSHRQEGRHVFDLLSCGDYTVFINDFCKMVTINTVNKTLE